MWLKSQVLWVMPEQVLLSTVPGQPPLSRWIAQANNMNFLSIWAIQRDNGGCPGTVDSNTCSGITQSTWDFSHILEPFTG